MGKRYESTQFGVDGAEWRVDIYDSEHSGSVTGFLTEKNSLRIEYQSSEEKLSAPIISSTCTFKMLIRSSLQGGILTDLRGAKDDRFRVAVYREDALEWVGVVLTDQIVYEIDSYPYLLQIDAVDGMERLSGIDYADDSEVNTVPYEGKETVIEHLMKIIDRLGTTDLMGTDVLTTAVNWYENRHASTSVDPLATTRFNHRAFLEFDNKTGSAKYMNCLDVLDMLAKTFHSRVCMSQGRIHFMQINEYEVNSFRIFNYNSSGTQTGTSTGNSFTGNTTVDLRGGLRRFFPGLKDASVQFIHKLNRNAISGADIASSFTLEDVDASATNTSLFLSCTARSYYAPETIDVPMFIAYRFQVSITDGTDTYYLKRDAEVVSGVVEYGEYSWTQASADRVTVYSGGPIQPNANLSFTYVDSTRVSILVNEVPVSGDLTIQGSFFKTVKIDGTDANISPTSSTEYVDPYLEIADLSDRSNARLYRRVNGTAGFSASYKYDNLLGDGISGNSPGNADIYNGSQWLVSTGSWKIGAKGTDGANLSGILAEAVLASRSAPTPRIQATFEGFARATEVIIVASENYIPMNMSINAHREEVSGEWVVVEAGTIAESQPDDESYYIPRDGQDTLRIGDEIRIGDPFADNNDGRRIREGQNTEDRVDIALRIPPFTVNGGIDLGSAITSIPTTAATGDDLFLAGDKIKVIDRYSGESQTFTVATDVEAGDTSIAINSATTTIAISDASYVTLDPGDLHEKLNKRWYRQRFLNHSSDTLTITENGGILPGDAAAIHVYAGPQRIFTYTVNGSDIELGFTPSGLDFTVEFYT